MKTALRILLTDTYVAAARVRVRRGRHEIIVHHLEPIEVPSTLHANVDWQPVGAAVHGAVSACGEPSGPADLIIPATWCYLNVLADTGPRFRREAAAYAFEEFLPRAIEDVTAAFVPTDAGTWAVAVPTEPLRRLIGHLEEPGLTIGHVLVDAFLLPAGVDEAAGPITGLALVDRRRLVLVQYEAGSRVPALIRPLLRPAEVCLDDYLAQQVRLTKAAVPTVATEWVQHSLEMVAEDEERTISPYPSSAQLPEAARRLLCADTTAGTLPDLRCDALAASGRWAPLATPAVRLMMLVALLLVVLLIDTVRTRQRYAADLSTLRQQQAALFRETLPQATLRASPALQLASERKRLVTLTGNPVPGATGPQALSLARAKPLNDLQSFVTHLPHDLRIKLLEVSIDAQQLSLRGQTVDHRDAERIAEAVGAIAGCGVSPPRTSRDRSGGVEFAIRARRASDAQ